MSPIQLLEVDSLGGTAVELEHDPATRAGDDRRRSASQTAVRNADTDRRPAGQGDGDYAARKRLAVGELGFWRGRRRLLLRAGCALRDLVCPGDDLSLVARLRVDEQEERSVVSVEGDAEQSLGGGRAPGGARVGGSTRAYPDRE